MQGQLGLLPSVPIKIAYNAVPTNLLAVLQEREKESERVYKGRKKTEKEKKKVLCSKTFLDILSISLKLQSHALEVVIVVNFRQEN